MDASSKKKDLPSKKEDSAADAAKPKSKPIHTFDDSDLRCSIFAFKSKDGSRVNYRYAISRSYKVDGEWKHSGFFGLEDPVEQLVKQAKEYIRSLRAQVMEEEPGE